MKTLLRWVDREARAADSDKIRAFCLHDGYRRVPAALGLLPGEVDDGVHREGQRRRPAAVLLRGHVALARHPRRFGPGPVSVPSAARRHRHRRRQPVGPARPRAADLREHLRAAEAARALRAPRRAADLRGDVAGRQPTSARSRCCAICCCGATAKSAPIITPGRRRPARPRTCGAIRMRRRFRCAAVRGAAGGADRGHRSRRRASGRSRTGPGASGSTPRHVAALERAGLPGRVERRAALLRSAQGRTRFRRGARSRPYFLSYDSAVRPGTSRLLEVPCSAMLHRDVPDRLAWAYARAPFPYTTKRVLRKLGRGARGLAAPVVFLARRDVRPGPPAGRTAAFRS